MKLPILSKSPKMSNDDSAQEIFNGLLWFICFKTYQLLID